MKNLIITAVVATSLFAGCSKASIYRPALAVDPIGYTSGDMKDGRHYVTMAGRPDTPKLQVYTFAFRRALEIADANGAQGIEVIGAFDQQARTDNTLFLLRSGAGSTSFTEGRRGPFVEWPYQLALEFVLVDNVDAYEPLGGVVVQTDFATADIEATILSEPDRWDL